LLISIPGEKAEQLIRDCHANEVMHAVIIGKINKGNPGIIIQAN
jgi:hypothetical protein